MAGVKALLFSLFAIILLVIGILNIIINYKENKCEMTWMFEQPEYLKIPMPKAVNERFPNYGLYVYGEGQYARILSSMKPFGIPVLFIPGNAGSHKQARSLASVAFRRANDKVKRYHFNFFTVSFNEELSGLYGAHLQEQTEFVRLVIKKIFLLYKGRDDPPKSIVLVGHSMGGVIARGLFTLPNFDANWVNTIFMQASPNKAPVIVLDPLIAEYYQRVNRYWRDHSNSTLGHITLVSSGGGELDVMVRGGLTPLDDIVDSDHGVSTTTTHIPKAWVSTDHKCIVWCKQVVLAFVRSLFDIVDEKKHQITEDVAHRMSVFRHHFLQHPGTGGFVSDWKPTITLDSKQSWTLMPDPVWKWEEEKIVKPTYLAVPLINFEDVDHVVIVSNIVEDSWVCFCTLEKGKKQCTSCQDLSSMGSALPPLYSNKKHVHVDLNDDMIADASHIVVVIQPTDKKVEVITEVYARDQKHVSNSLPGLFEIAMSLPESVTKGALVLDLGNKAAFYRIKLYNLNTVIKVYTAHLVTSKCTQKNTGEHAGSVMRFQVPWSNEDVYQFIKYGESGNMSVKLQYIPPVPTFSPDLTDFSLEEPMETYDSVELYLHLDPTCTYKLRFTASFRDMLGQFVRFYGTLLPAFCVGGLLITLSFQLRSLAKDGVCPSVLDSLWETKPYMVVPFSLLMQALLQFKVVEKQLDKFFIPTPDIVTLDKQGVTFRTMQLLLYLIALGITTVHAGVISLIVQMLSRVMGPISGCLPDTIRSLYKIVAVLVCLGAGGVAVVSCGTLAMFICYVLTFLQLVHLCYTSRQSGEITNRSQYHLTTTVFMLWMWLLILNSPALIVWWKGAMELDVYQLPSTDPSKMVGILATIAFLGLYLCSRPLQARSLFKTVALLIHLLVIMMFVFGMVSLYRVSYFIIAALLTLSSSLVILKLKSSFTQRPKTE